MIKTKLQMKEMLARGCFGNTMRNWSSFDDLRSSGYSGFVYVRTNRKMDKAYFEIPADQVAALDVDHNNCHYYESPANELRVFQGEIYRGTKGFYLQYSLAKKPLRDALNESPVHVFGASALAILRHFVPSWDWLIELVDTHDAIVEFSQFSEPVGVHQSGLVVWEVRNY